MAKAEKMFEVLSIIRNSGSCTAKQICDRMGLSAREVSGLLKGLRLRGLIRIKETRSHSGNVWTSE